MECNLLKKIKKIPSLFKHNRHPIRYLFKYMLGIKDIDEFMKRPFQSKDLRSVPKNYNNLGPDFVGVGYSKAGTSWWWQLIQKHPQVISNRLGVKETSYFHHFLYHRPNKKEIEVYREAFLTPDEKISGEYSPSYLMYPFAMKNLQQVAPNTKIIVIVRNPIDETISTWNHVQKVRSRYMNLSPQKNYIFKTYSLFKEAISNNYFRRHIQKLDKLFSKDQILFLQFEKNKDQPLKEVKKTYNFLGIEGSFEPSVKVKEAGSNYIVDQPNEKERKRLADYFREDVKALKEYTKNIDIDYWPDFK